MESRTRFAAPPSPYRAISQRGKVRISKKEYVQMLSRARGSTYEVQTQLEISRNLSFLATDAFEILEMKAAEVGRLLNGLITKLRRDIDEEETLKTQDNKKRSPKT